MMNRMSRQFEGMGGSDLGELTGGDGGTAVDVADRGDELVVTADLPGFRTDDVEVTVQGEQLRISAERDEEREESDEDGHYIRKERRHESVSRSVTIPEEVDESNATAEFQNGVLTVTLPKKQAGEGDSHRIDIG